MSKLRDFFTAPAWHEEISSFCENDMKKLQPVDVQLSVVRQIVVDDERDLLDVNTTRPDVSRDENAAETK